MVVVVGCGTRYNTRGSIHNQQIRVVGMVVVVRLGTPPEVVFIVSKSELSAWLWWWCLWGVVHIQMWYS